MTDLPAGTDSRHLPSFVPRLIFLLGVVIAIGHIYFNVFVTLPNIEQNTWHYAGFVILCALIYPLSGSSEKRPLWMLAFDVGLGLLTAVCALYMQHAEDAIYARGVSLSTLDWICGGFLVLSALEFTRRTTGWIIPGLIVLALTYVGWWGDMISGVFRFAGLHGETILFRSIYGDDGLFGSIARISSSFVFMFILFGAFLLRSGAGDFIIDLARAVAGRTVGGPGFVAVIASGLTGTISGSAVANTASTGVITIPLMQKAGFPPKFAAATEAASSTGGQLMPPIMGAGAFVMASYTQIPYTTIVAVSFLPTLLYFISIIFYVRVVSLKTGVRALDDEADVPSLGEVMKRGGLVFLLPVLVLVGLLIYGFTPTFAAGYAILSVVVASWFSPNRMGPREVLEAMALGARNMTMTAVLLCAVGLIVNVIAMAGVGNTFSLMITEWAGNSLLLALTLIALASLVLGMGLPVTAAYIVLATLSAPALYNLIAEAHMVAAVAGGAVAEEVRMILMLTAPEQAAMLGQSMSMAQASALLATVPPDMLGMLREQLVSPEILAGALLSAHMIIFWLSQDSNVTPPVCLTAFTAAAIAKTPPMATGVASWKVAKGLYIVPLLFAYTDFLASGWLAALEIFVFALAGIYALVAAIEGFLEHALGWPLRAGMALLGALLLWPGLLAGKIVGAVLLIVVVVWSRNQAGRTSLTSA